MSKVLGEIVGEAREGLAPDAVDWEAFEARLFARVEAERRAGRGGAGGRRGPMWMVLAAAVSVAAVVAALVVRSGRDERAARGVAAESAAVLLAIDGSGEVLIDGRPAAVGASLRLGDAIEGRGARAMLVRPGKLTFVVEAGARAVVTGVEAPLVLALERGAVDAQVVPVRSGQAFAVDVGGSRVAVHGTRLRVARDGGRVVIDLSQGVVSVDEISRAGAVAGALMAAPAHAEFATTNAGGTLVVTHDPAAVRAPSTTLAPPPSEPSSPPRAPPAHTADVRSPPQATPRAAPASSAQVAAPARAPAAAPAQPAAPTVPDPDAATMLRKAVQACMAERPGPDNVTIVVSTTLHLELDADGYVRTAQFRPPVAPDVNACAAQAIYRTRFSRSGSIDIRADFSE